MTLVGKHSGAPSDQGAIAAQRRRLLQLAVGATATAVAWGFLVKEAIDFGSRARAGETLAWVFLALATVGAAACMFVTLILGGRIVTALRGQAPPPKPPSVGGRRAAR